MDIEQEKEPKMSKKQNQGSIIFIRRSEKKMATQWTKEQQQVIDHDNRNILVSAAAGSGKTAVLVERILKKMTRQEHPVDIDKLLIVTFTRAAAGEMRDRLMAALEKQLEMDPDNEHLQRQQTLIHNAQITTIDGFCSYVIRNYFHMIDLDPGFRIGNEGEIRLLKQDVAKEVLEAEYAKRTEEFDRFIEVFATGKTDEGILDLVQNLYEFSTSNPWPKEWLETCKAAYELDSVEALDDSVWIEKLWQDTDHYVEQIETIIQENKRKVLQPDGPYMYEAAVDEDKRLLESIKVKSRGRDFDGMAALLSECTFQALSRKKDSAVSEIVREQVKAARDEMKELIRALKEKYFYSDRKGILAELEICRGPVEELIRLTEAFMDAYAAKKRQKNLVDFSDIEHFALDILVQKEGENYIYSEAAEEFADRFEEILIDEYQDSNLVQETLLTSVSRLRRGIHNIFMVGDVKQSIYRFRLARPELFMEKYATYTLGESPCQRIDLHRNFRSRKEVLAGVNYIFFQIMGKSLGEVEYDSDAALYPGAEFPENESAQSFQNTEILLVPVDEPEGNVPVNKAKGNAPINREEGNVPADETRDDVPVQELEARAVGKRIREIVGKEWIYDKAAGVYRKAEYRDCVILLRTVSGWAESFVQVLMEMNIPAYATSRTGYFSATEVVTVLNYLHICDNPRQELPFTGVLLSPIGGLTAGELAKIKAAFPEEKIYGAVQRYWQEGDAGVIRTKLEHFFTVYNSIRERVSYTPIHELIQMILRETGYGNFAYAMAGGRQRSANLEMLVEKAMEYESTSYHGLFNFLRYMEQLQRYQVDFGEVSTVGEGEDTVRIMSIHKSKGLEYPIVFVSGMGKHMNMSDANAGLVIHQDLGLGTWAIDPVRRLRIPTLLRQIIQRQIRLESLGEELRVLYVALTRAKEKLILTGTIDGTEKKMADCHTVLSQKEIRLSFTRLSSAKTYWDWILPAAARHSAFAEFAGWEKNSASVVRPGGFSEQESASVVQPGGFSEQESTAVVRPAGFSEPDMVFRMIGQSELAMDEMVRLCVDEELYKQFSNWDTEEVFDKELRSQMESKFSYQYPYTYLQEIPAKVSVSELKKAGMRELEEEEAEELLRVNAEEAEWEPYLPAFAREEEPELRGAARGTAYHTVLANLAYDRTETQEQIREQIGQMRDAGKIDEITAECVSERQIMWFVRSAEGQRMKKAWEKGKLWREQPFVMSIPAERCKPEWNTAEPVLIQGIIDVFWEENGEWILLDYKTDYIEKGQEDILINRYRIQLQLYKEALERMREYRVKEVYIYSFALGKSIPVPV